MPASAPWWRLRPAPAVAGARWLAPPRRVPRGRGHPPPHHTRSAPNAGALAWPGPPRPARARRGHGALEDRCNSRCGRPAATVPRVCGDVLGSRRRPLPWGSAFRCSKWRIYATARISPSPRRPPRQWPRCPWVWSVRRPSGCSWPSPDPLWARSARKPPGRAWPSPGPPPAWRGCARAARGPPPLHRRRPAAPARPRGRRAPPRRRRRRRGPRRDSGHSSLQTSPATRPWKP
mmetsp:Transcript_98771/g.274884  ORF Transcript_98771/g.274884 Transcript_98771/m.274884 type:complete len:233 (-) Transcript_98771:94-792(-)